MEIQPECSILDTAVEAISSLLPVKSKERYEKCYKLFCDWRAEKAVEGVDENIMLAFFFEKAKTLKASSLWSTYSMVKSTLQINENVDISCYKKLVAFLKRQNDSYEAKKSQVLTMENVLKFLTSAPDNTFLLMKVVLIFGLSGACRRAELCALKTEDIEDVGSVLIVTLHDTKTKKKRVFTVTSECNGIEYYRKYASLRPKNVSHGRFFLFYKAGKCSVQPVGINSFAKMPKKIAEYLNLPNASSYTGHCLRRTSATLLADSGADIQTLKRHGGWQSTSVAEGYIEDSISNKVKTSKKIFSEAAGITSASSAQEKSLIPSEAQESNSLSFHQTTSSWAQETSLIPSEAQESNSLAFHQTTPLNFKSSSVTFSNLHNCIFHIHNNNPNK